MTHTREETNHRQTSGVGFPVAIATIALSASCSNLLGLDEFRAASTGGAGGEGGEAGTGGEGGTGNAAGVGGGGSGNAGGAGGGRRRTAVLRWEPGELLHGAADDPERRGVRRRYASLRSRLPLEFLQRRANSRDRGLLRHQQG